MTTQTLNSGATEKATKPSVVVTRVTDDTADAVAEFMMRVWGGTTTGDRVRRWIVDSARTNPALPGEPVPAIVYMRDAEALGYLGSIPVRFWNGASETPAHWLKGFMVLPQHQNGPVGFALLREMLRHVGLSATMTVALPARRLFQAVGYVDCGAMPNYVSLLRAGRVAAAVDLTALDLHMPPLVQRLAAIAQKSGLAFIGGAVGGAGLRALKAIRPPSAALAVQMSGSLPPRHELDELWLRARPNIAAGAVRDGAYLTWRYDARPGGQYEAVAIRERGDRKRLRGVAIVRRSTENPDERLRGVNLATLADLVFDPADQEAGVAVVAGAERCARRLGADALLCSATHGGIMRVLKRRRFIQLGGTVRLMIREPRGAAKFSHGAHEWWLMRGDANSDDGF